ncbi:MAG: lysophospholipid acyltransferase family protein [Lachnospiraceae bacterium]
MFKLIYVIFRNLFRAPYMIPRMNYEGQHPEKFDEKTRYALVQYTIYLMQKTAKISTISFGEDNLPKEGGYVMIPNHQGKYDALGIMSTHKEPCTFVMDKAKSHTILVGEFVDLVQGKRLDKKDVRQAMRIINQVAKDVKNGKKYILFPEGGYKFNNKNVVTDFKAGSFKSAVKAKAPIVPVALIDSYRAFNSFDIGPVVTQVHYLKPLYYEDYKNLKTMEIAEEVKQRIERAIEENLYRTHPQHCKKGIFHKR